MELIKIAMIVVATLIISTVMKGIRSELSIFPVMLLTVAILFVAIESFSELYAGLTSVLADGFARTGFTYLLKVTGICLMTDFVSDFSSDVGYSSLANAVSLLGRISMMMCVMPLIFEIIDF